MKKTVLFTFLVFFLLFDSIGQTRNNVKIIVSNKPGGAIDIMCRKFAIVAKKYTDIEFTIVNIPGGAGISAMTYVKNQNTNDLTILATLKSFLSSGLLSNDLISINDFKIVACMVYDWECIITNNGSSIQNFQDIMQDAATKDGSQRWVGPNIGGVDHLMAFKTWSECKIKAKWIPFDGSSQAIISLLAKDGSVYVGNPIDVKGRPNLEIAAIASPKRSKDFPLTPTFKELGYNFEMQMWRGFSVSKKTSPQDISMLEDLFFQVSNDKEWISYIESTFAEPVFIKGDKFDKLISQEEKETKILLSEMGLIRKSEDKNIPLIFLLAIFPITFFALKIVQRLRHRKMNFEGIIYSLIIGFALFFILQIAFLFPSGTANEFNNPSLLPLIWSSMLAILGIISFLGIPPLKETPILSKRTLFLSISLLVLYGILMGVIGFYVTSFLFILGFLILIKKAFNFTYFLQIPIILFGIYIVFELLLKMNLPKGILL